MYFQLSVARKLYEEEFGEDHDKSFKLREHLKTGKSVVPCRYTVPHSNLMALRISLKVSNVWQSSNNIFEVCYSLALLVHIHLYAVSAILPMLRIGKNASGNTED